jgi:glutaredoxin
VKEFLSQHGKTFEVKYVDEDDAAYDELLARGFRSVPVTVIGDTAISGYDPEALLRALASGG